MKRKNKLIRLIICILLSLVLFVFLITGSINLYMINGLSKYIYNDSSALSRLSEEKDFDCILVLGCGVINNQPSVMLEDRLNVALELYNLGIAPKILLSGDHGKENYDEVNVMRSFMLDKGVKSEDIFMDHAGFSTYESMKRAEVIFNCKTIVVVTQEYHLYRSIYDSRELGIESYGIIADRHIFVQQPYYTFREILARVKDFFLAKINPHSAYVGGDVIDIHGNGEVTLD